MLTRAVIVSLVIGWLVGTVTLAALRARRQRLEPTPGYVSAGHDG